MFDNLNVTKAYKLQDTITGNDIEVATFNAHMTKGSNINVFMNINYPRLYETNKDEILEAYRDFNAEISSLAYTMELASSEAIATYSKLKSLEPLREELKTISKDIFMQIIESLGDIKVNPVPQIEVGYNPYR